MCYCEKCGRYFNRPKLGPRKVLESGFLRYPTYDLGVWVSHFEYESYVQRYYYLHNLYCPKCGALYESMRRYNDEYWAKVFGEFASRSDMELYFNYCRRTAGNHFPGFVGYPGDVEIG